jgi:large subunit ribosomal protein L1
MAKKKKTEETVEVVAPVVEVSAEAVAEPVVEKKAKAAKKPAKKASKKKEAEEAETVMPVAEEKVVKKAIRLRGKRYVSAKAYVDRTKTYPANEAIALAKKTHYAKFPGSLEVNLVMRGEGTNVDVTFPFATGRSVKVAIVTDELLKEVEQGKISFTKLIAHPSMMPKLSKLARVLGPKGLMPNPKDGTLTPDPEKRKKELESGAVTVKAEKKAPLLHTVIGKLSQPEKELEENLAALLKAFAPGKVVKCSISATMGPGIKVKID